MIAESMYCPTCQRSVVAVGGACPACGRSLTGAALVPRLPRALSHTRVDTAEELHATRALPPGYVTDLEAVDVGAYRAVRSLSSLHVIGVRDRSISMRWRQKAREANKAFQELTESLAAEENRDGFHISVIDFHHQAEFVVPRMRASEAVHRLPDLRTGGNGTNYVAALSLACTEAERPRDAFEGRPVVVVLGDGCHNGAGDPRVEAHRLRGVADVVVAVAFGNDADEDLLRDHIASEPRFFWRIQESGAELRRFFADLGRTLSYSLQTGASTASTLATLR